jgi:hypothetical protein
MVNLIRLYDNYVLFIIVVKVLFLLAVVLDALLNFLSVKINVNKQFLSFMDSLKKNLDFVFILSVAVLLMIVFRPRRDGRIEVDFKERIIFFVYGILLIIDNLKLANL